MSQTTYGLSNGHLIRDAAAEAKAAEAVFAVFLHDFIGGSGRVHAGFVVAYAVIGFECAHEMRRFVEGFAQVAVLEIAYSLRASSAKGLGRSAT